MKDNGYSFSDEPAVVWSVETSSWKNASDTAGSCNEEGLEQPEDLVFTMDEISHLLDQMIMDIQHLELEVVRARYKLSFYLSPPHGEWLRQEIFSSMGSRYAGDPVYDSYLSYHGLSKNDDAIDTPFHLKRMERLAAGHDDYPDLYP